MSFQGGPPPQGPPPGAGPPPQGPPPQQSGAKNPADEIHSIAVQAEKALEALATGLAHAGVDASVTGKVTSWADGVRKILTVLGQGPDAAANQAPGGPQPQQAPQSMDQGIAAVHQHMQQSAHQGY